jgi:hypothetical protein
MIGHDVSEFESDLPSHAVESLCACSPRPATGKSPGPNCRKYRRIYCLGWDESACRTQMNAESRRAISHDVAELYQTRMYRSRARRLARTSLRCADGLVARQVPKQDGGSTSVSALNQTPAVRSSSG